MYSMLIPSLHMVVAGQCSFQPAQAQVSAGHGSTRHCRIALSISFVISSGASRASRYISCCFRAWEYLPPPSVGTSESPVLAVIFSSSLNLLQFHHASLHLVPTQSTQPADAGMVVASLCPLSSCKYPTNLSQMETLHSREFPVYRNPSGPRRVYPLAWICPSPRLCRLGSTRGLGSFGWQEIQARNGSVSCKRHQ